MIHVEVSGPEHAGKGHLIALITNFLREQNLDVVVQCEETHYEDKFNQTKEQHIEKLVNRKIVISEMKTYK